MEKIFVRKECNRCLTCFLHPTFAVLRTFGLSGVVPTDQSCEALATRFEKPRTRWRDILTVAILWSVCLYTVVLCVIVYMDEYEDGDKLSDGMALVMITRHFFSDQNQLIVLVVSALVHFQGAVNSTVLNFCHTRDAVTDTFGKLWKESNQGLYANTEDKDGKWKLILTQKVTLYAFIPLEMLLTVTFWVYFFGNSNLGEWPELSVLQMVFVFSVFVLCPFWLVLLMSLSFIHFVSVCRLIKWKFNCVVKELQELSEQPQAITSIKKVHAKHHKICKIVEATDKFMRYYIFATYAVSLPSICVLLHFLYSESKDANLNIILGMLAGGLIFLVLAITLSSGSVTSSGHRPKEVLHSVSILAVPKEIRLEINIFLERLGGPTIGFTCLDFFVITSGTLTSIASVVVTYLLMYLQFNQSRKNK